MKTAQRYEPDENVVFDPCPTGPWVKFTDHALTVAAMEAARKEIDIRRKREDMMDKGVGQYVWMTDPASKQLNREFMNTSGEYWAAIDATDAALAKLAKETQ